MSISIFDTGSPVEWLLVLMVGLDEIFVDKDWIIALVTERRKLEKETGFTSFIRPGCGVIIIIIIIIHFAGPPALAQEN